MWQLHADSLLRLLRIYLGRLDWTGVDDVLSLIASRIVYTSVDFTLIPTTPVEHVVNLSYSAFTLGRHVCSMEAFTLATCRAICRATCVKECEQSVQVILNETGYTQTHVNAHLDTQCDVIAPFARTKYRRCRGHADFVVAHCVQVLSN